MVGIRLEGGLCNQLFQMAFILAFAKKHNLEYCIPTQVNNPHIPGKGAYFFTGVNYCDVQPALPVYRQKTFTYEEIPKMDNVCFEGYFQSFKYFDNYRDYILKVFGFDWELKKNYVSIHWRLGDYEKLPDHHPPVTEKYLRNAIEYMYHNAGENLKFKFYSDNMQRCREFGDKTFSQYPDMVEYSEGKDEIEDLQDASSCSSNIGSNSSYSLWIYYLNQNPNKLATFPRTWFGPQIKNETIDLYPTGSVVL